MSTKNLARTVIEGGRRPSNRFFRWQSNRTDRRRAHELEKNLSTVGDPEAAIFEPREVVSRSFSDKLGPARRWLRSQVGRPWDKVRSDLFERFDARTTAGRHILFCHLLRDVDDASNPHSRYCEFEVSPRGTLRYRGSRRGHHWQRPPALPEPEAVLRAWFGTRRVLGHAERLYWLLPTPRGAFRQHHELTPAEAVRFRALPQWFREQHEGTLPTPGAAIN